jgi:long-chain acyl-CoA synthetase
MRGSKVRLVATVSTAQAGDVYSREVEETLYGHPDIAEVAVVGVPDANLGEDVAAVVVMLPAARRELEPLHDWDKRSLSAYKVPRIMQFVDQLPKGPAGKILEWDIDRDAVRMAARERGAA